MSRVRSFLAALAALLLAAGAAHAALQETPFFAKDVAAGKLPPVVKRTPERAGAGRAWSNSASSAAILRRC